MTSSLLEGQLWIWGLTPTSLHPHPQESLRPTFGKATFFSLGQGMSSTARWAWARDPRGHCLAGCRGQSRIQPLTFRGACGLIHLSHFSKMETLKKPPTPHN